MHIAYPVLKKNTISEKTLFIIVFVCFWFSILLLLLFSFFVSYRVFFFVNQSISHTLTNSFCLFCFRNWKLNTILFFICICIHNVTKWKNEPRQCWLCVVSIASIWPACRLSRCFFYATELWWCDRLIKDN